MDFPRLQNLKQLLRNIPFSLLFPICKRVVFLLQLPRRCLEL